MDTGFLRTGQEGKQGKFSHVRGQWGLRGVLSRHRQFDKSLWLRISGQTNTGNGLVCVYYSLCYQDGVLDDIFRHLEAPCLHALVSEVFSSPDDLAGDNGAGHKQSRVVLQCPDKFLSHKSEELILASKTELGGIGQGSLGSSCNEMEFRIMKGGNEVKSRVIDLDFKRSVFVLFMCLLG